MSTRVVSRHRRSRVPLRTRRARARARSRKGLRLSLLGGFELHTSVGRRLRVPSKKAQALLAYLALGPGQAHTRAKLANLLWGEFDSEKARNSVRQALFVLRRALSPLGAEPVRFEGELVSLAPGVLEVDAVDFRSLAAASAPAQRRRALELYHGELLDGLDVTGAEAFEEWLVGERRRLRELAAQALAEDLARATATASDRRAIEAALRLLALDPLRESAHRALMRLYAAHGRRTAALEQYQSCVDTLQRELGVEPEPETQRLYQELLPLSGRAPSSGGPKAGGLLPERAPAGPPLVGRREELGQIASAVSEARRRHARVVIVVGEAGVGKTRLLEEAVADAVRRGARLLVGRGHESERSLPFGPWLDALRDAGLPREPSVWRALPPASRNELARLFPELSEGGRGEPENVGRLFEAVARCLVLAAARQPVVVVLEDLHWADEMTLRLLSYVGRRVPGAFLVLGSARAEDLSTDSTLHMILDEVERDGRLQRVTLAPLARADTLALVGALLSSAQQDAAFAATAERIWTLSEGNPFVVVEAIRSLGAVGGRSPGAALALPARVREVVEARLARLSAASRNLLGLAALIGRDFDFALLSRACGLDLPRTAACIEELVRHQVLRGAGERLLFVHDRVREVAEAAVTSVRRPAIHRAVAQALEVLHTGRLHEVYDRLATHWARAREEEKAVAYLGLAAGQDATRYALPEALGRLEEAAHLAAGLPPGLRQRSLVEIAVQQATVLHYAGRVPEIPERLKPYEASLTALDDPGLAGRFHFALGFAGVILGDRDGASAHLQAAIRDGEQAGDGVTAGSARAVLSFEYVWASRFREGADLAGAAARALAATGERHWLGKACFYGSVHCAVLGDFASAMRAQARAEAIARETSDQRLLTFATWALGFIQALRGKRRAALVACRRAVALAPDACGAANAYGFLGYAHLVAGQAAEAVSALERGARESAHFGFKAQQGWFLAWAGEAHLLRRDPRLAAARAEEALALTRATGFRLGVGCAERALARVALARRARSEARRRLEAAAETFAAVGAAVDLATTRGLLATAARQARVAGGSRRSGSSRTRLL